jgi:Do/DeqQ family serine protease
VDLSSTFSVQDLARNGFISLIWSLALVVSLWFAPYSEAALPWSGGDQSLPSLAPMLGQITPAVVNIATEGRVQMRQNPLLEDPFFRFFFNFPDQPLERKTQSLGSGVIVDAERGLVITNNHVIANADQIAVNLRDGRKLEAKLVGADPETDITVIKVSPTERLISLPMADSNQLKVGDFVVAIGNPFGLGQTVTSGIVSALGRSGLGIEGYEDFIQTDASINPGNSGGALVNLNGRLVGINTAIFSQTGGNIGIGFAIPINMVRQVMEQLVKHGEVKRGFLGAQLQDLDPELAEAFGLSQNQGAVLVNVIAGSPAEKAGLKPGDVITAINERSVHTASAVRNEIGLLRVGEQVKLEILRNGKPMQIMATISEQTETAAHATDIRNRRLAGVTVGDIPKGASQYGHLEGAMVFKVERGSHAWRSGLRDGDIIISVNRVPVTDVKGFLKLVNKLRSGILLQVQRGDMALFIMM